MFAALITLAAGLLFFWMGWRHWKYRDAGAPNLIETAYMKATGDEPFEKTDFDRNSHRVQAVLSFVLGAFLLVCAVAVLVAS